MAAKKKQQMQSKGIKSTEFWLTVVTSVVGLLIMTGVVDPDGSSATDQIAGVIVATLSSMGYSISRGLAKSKSDEL